MLSQKRLADSAKRLKKAERLDETGKTHQYYAYRVPTTEEEILKLAGSVDGSKRIREQNVQFFKDRTNLVHVVERDRFMYDGRDAVPAMESALIGMKALQGFLFSECVTQSTPGPNRGGKTQARIQKLVNIAVGSDPLRPGYEFPFDASKGPIIIWSCVPAKNTRTELMDLQRRVPPGVKFKLFTAKGEERVEFDPTDERPYGAIIRVKSYSMPVDQFQREAVHVISMDEKCPPYIWDECRMRLLSTNGWMILAMALYDLEIWLYEKNYRFDPKYRNVSEGPYGWYSWDQANCPWVNQARAAEEAANLSDDARAARIHGDPKLLSGTSYFKPAEMVGSLWQRFSRNPLYAMRFNQEGKPAFSPYEGKSRWRLWEMPKGGHTYAIGADPASGGGGDADDSAAHVLCLETNEIVGVFQDNAIEADDFGLELLLAGYAFNTATVAIEVNVERAATHHWLKQNGYPRIYQRQTFGGRIQAQQEAYGWYTDSRSKEWALEELRRALKATYENKGGGIVLYDTVTYQEISDFGYLREKRHKAHGLGGLVGHDDLVMSLAITLQAATQAPKIKMMLGKKILTTSLDAEVEKMFKDEEKRLRDSKKGLPRVSLK